MASPSRRPHPAMSHSIARYRGGAASSIARTCRVVSRRAVLLCSLISLARLPAPLTFLHGFRPMISLTTAQSIIPEKNENR